MFSWKNKKVLITGVTGFVGANLFKKLEELGADTFGISRNLDITDFLKLNDFVKKNKISICFHLAAEALVEKGQNDPYQTFKTNIEGTFNILESSRLNKLERIVIASTAHVYGDNKAPYLEEYPPRPSRPYETSKACADLISQAYADTYDLPVLIPRFVNIYGPGDRNYNRLVPKTIISILNGGKPKMWGGDAKRQYLYIDDAIDAYIKLGEIDKTQIHKNRIYNFGEGYPISVRDLIEKIIKLSGKNFNIEMIQEERPNEISAQYVSSEKAKYYLNWLPKFSLDEGLLNTIEWYSRNK